MVTGSVGEALSLLQRELRCTFEIRLTRGPLDDAVLDKAHA